MTLAALGKKKKRHDLYIVVRGERIARVAIKRGRENKKMAKEKT